MNFEELGNALRRAREERGLSLEEIAEVTKISRPVLEAIEQAAPSMLPHRVYAKAFIREYTRRVGAEIENLNAVLDGIFDDGDREREKLESFAAMHGRAENEFNVWYKFMPVVVLVLVIGLLGGVYLLYQTFSPLDTSSLPEPQTVTGLETEAPSRPGELPAEASDASSVVSGPTGNQTDQDRILPYAGKEAEDINASLMANGSQPSFQDRAYSEQQFSSVAEPSVPSPTDQEDSVIKGHELRIKADMDCWMRVVSDDYSRQLFLRPGQEVVFGFDRSVSVKFGNAGGVRLFLDGSPYPFDAQSGEVKSLVLTADDIQSQG